VKPTVSMREALEAPALLGGALPGPSWKPWRAMLIGAMGEALTDEEREVFRALTGREQEPLQRVEEFWGIVGRRAGKTRAAGTLAAYVGTLCDHGGYLADGERAVIPVLAASMSQAARAFQHARGVLEHSPELCHELDGDPTADTIRLTTRVDIEVKPASFRTVRSITAPLAIVDEIGFWLIEGSRNPDAEILNALRPALATTGGMLWAISSPHAKRGELFTAFRKFYRPDGDPLVLVAKGPSRAFNSTLPQSVVDRAYERDAAVASAEYGGEFRGDLEPFVARETVEACIEVGVFERPPAKGVTYKAFVDPSGGSADSMTLAIGHRSKDGSAVVDAMREVKPPFAPDQVVKDFAELLKAYGLHEITGDRYGGVWPRDRFKAHGIGYVLTERSRSQLYQELLPTLNSRRAVLLDSTRLVDQISGLERRVARGGSESIDHAPGGHDDLANAVAGVIQLIAPRHDAPVAASSRFSWDAPISLHEGSSQDYPSTYGVPVHHVTTMGT